MNPEELRYHGAIAFGVGGVIFSWAGAPVLGLLLVGFALVIGWSAGGME